MSDDLVEKVIDAMSNCGSETVGSRMARAAIAVCMEEAAQCVRRMPSPSSNWMADELLHALGGPANQIPAAIRALIKE